MANMAFRADEYTVKESDWRTFGEWRALNMGVLKGEKARRFRHGVAVFHRSQTAYMPDYGCDGDGDFDPYNENWAMSRECNGW